jgi:hypothetical protein
VDFGLSVAPQNRRREVDAGHVEASLARVFQSSLKTGGDAVMGGTRDNIMEVALEAS